MYRVKSDALFSYQPPFNLFAFLILWPLSCVLTPRALHTANVFLIRLTVSSAFQSLTRIYAHSTLYSQSFPTLVVIGIYERFLSKGQRLRESGTGAAHDIYSSFTRGVKHVPFLERLVGASTTDLYDAIFDVDVSHGLGLFEPSDDEAADRPAFGSHISRESLHVPSSSTPSPTNLRRARSAPHSPSSVRRHSGLPRSSVSPRRAYAGLPSLIEPSGAPEVQTVGPRSPLNRLFTSRIGRESSASYEKMHSPNVEAGMKRIESLVEDIRQLPVNKLKEEMKELQVGSDPCRVLRCSVSLTVRSCSRIVRRELRTSCSC